MTPTQQLYNLPEPIQAELWGVVRAVAGMSQDERIDVMAALTGVAEAFLVYRPLTREAVLSLVNAVGQVVTQVDHAAFPRTAGVV